MHPFAQRHLSSTDRWLCHFDRALRTLTPGTPVTARPSPAESAPEGVLSDEQRRHAAGLMRVNHAGEVCAQALYQGQSLTAKLPKVRAEMEQAAAEEIDHLAWCEQRLKQLHSQPSRFNPVWYGLSFTLGAGAGLISDRVSLGFVAATEDQVCQHLDNHLQSLPEADTQSQAVVRAMREDEYRHGQAALQAGGWVFPKPIKAAMTGVSRLMTWVSYRI